VSFLLVEFVGLVGVAPELSKVSYKTAIAKAVRVSGK
jgi:hypothetical protein